MLVHMQKLCKSDECKRFLTPRVNFTEVIPNLYIVNTNKGQLDI